MEDTLMLIVGISVFLLLVMLATRPRVKPHKPERTGRPDFSGQAAFGLQRNQPVPVPRSDEAAWEHKVLMQLRGDRAVMERLLAYQAKRVPRASRKQLLEMIHADYIRDQR